MAVEFPAPTPEWRVLLEVTSILDELQIPYMLTGSMALGLYAVPRMTRDLDIVVELSARHAPQLRGRLGDRYYVSEQMIRDAVEHCFKFNIICHDPIVKVDFVIRKEEPYRIEEMARRRSISIHGQPLAVVSPEDLLLSKLHWSKDSHSEMQLRDVRNLIAAVADLDWSYIDRWASALEVQDLLREVRP